MPEPITPERVRALLEDVTAPPWRAMCIGSEGHLVYSETVRRGGRVAVCTDAPFTTCKADAALIAAAPDIARDYLAVMAEMHQRELHHFEAERDADEWRERAEQAETALARVRNEVDSWPCGDETCDGECTGCAYARDLIRALDGADS